MADVIDLEIEDLGRFRKVGSGGFATVYAAWDEGFRRWVAVKVLPTLDEDGRRRFDRERALMGQLDAHPYVVTPYRSGYTSSGDAYLVMEYLEGGSLQEKLDQRGSLRLDEAIDYLLPITEAVEAGHRRGILHLDIKPANILVTSDGVPKLTDFGISSTRDATTTMAAFTLAHAPPESFADGFDRQDERSDLYSLASTLYTLVRGRPPFEIVGQDSVRAHLMRILTHPPKPIGRPEVDEFFALGMAKDPRNRHQTADELAAAMRALHTGGRPEAGLANEASNGASSGRSAAAEPSQAQSTKVPLSMLAGRVFEASHVDRAGSEAADPIPPRPANSDGRSDRRPPPTPQHRRSSKTGMLTGAGIMAVVLAAGAALFLGSTSANVQPAVVSSAPVTPTTFDVAIETTEGASPTTGPPPFETSPVTAPGPGSFSIGQLKLGLLTADDFPTGWTIGADSTGSDDGMALPCNGGYGWEPNSSSPQAIGQYHGPTGSTNIVHTVWAMDVWVAEDLFAEATEANLTCAESWTQPTGDDGETALDVALAANLPIAEQGHETVVSTLIGTSDGGDERHVVTILTRCDGLISRLEFTTAPASEGAAIDDLTDTLTGAAYDHLIGVAEWENATCPSI